MLRILEAAGMDVVALTTEQSKYGAVETREESRRCAICSRAIVIASMASS